ncbi:hypothetical protein CHH48_01595 [Terribacillus saccharophilus]|uniref:Flavinylation-associated cytochrome domain-containing protein n=1 Tax=Terribacillus saccharophilus TaxID=361277 RepID=A0ABX4H3H0_9BACI|nr:hypothetical protein CHH56_00900 [Terribacillus saccharophilus]PAD97916.1 hypothetical protein CHH50_01605 [Terribacillus saccharophilus]PAE01684.1 hypothetical protein CHH48_01595 [Terribacillus saccharophilus]
MNVKMLLKLTNDLAMTILLLLAMAYQITGNTMHELVGASLFVLFVLHNILNRRWYKTIIKGRYNLLRFLKVSINLLFLFTMTAVLFSALPISQDVFPFITVNNDMLFRQIHVITAYWGLILMSIHIGLSWGMIVNAVRKMTGITGTNRIRTLCLRLLAVLIVVYGIRNSFERNLGSKLTVYDPFGFWVSNDSSLRFLIEYLSVVGIYIFGTHYTLKFIQKHSKYKRSMRGQ